MWSTDNLVSVCTIRPPAFPQNLIQIIVVLLQLTTVTFTRTEPYISVLSKESAQVRGTA
jgi:hypothetical protein